MAGSARGRGVVTTALAPLRPHGQWTAPPPPGFSSRRPLLLGFLTLSVLAAGLFGWGAFASISGAVIASGRVEVGTGDQVVEHIDGGTVGEILVRDGARIAAGEVLIRLEDAALRTEETILRGEQVELAARRNRLEAEFRGADAIAWDADLAALVQGDASVQEVLEGQQRLFEARHSSWAGQVAQLRERIGQTRRQIAGLEAQADAAARQRGFIGRELDAQRSLFEKGLTELRRLLELEREAARLDGVAGDIVARIAGARGRIAEIEIAILQLGAQRVEQAEGEARDVQARENEVRERLAGVRRRLGSMEVRAPVAGEVHGMRVFALGEVVRPGEPILNIVPADAGLKVMARLDPIHVDQVHPGQEAMLRFSAFPARTTPEYAGRVARVSADARHDERTGLSWYEVELALGEAIEPDAGTGIGAWPGRAARTAAGWLPAGAGAWLRRNAPDPVGGWLGDRPSARPGAKATPGHALDLALTPGMPVEVHVRTGERSPLSYLAKPLTDYFSRSLREE